MDDLLIKATIAVLLFEFLFGLYTLSCPDDYIKYFKLRRVYQNVDKYNCHMFYKDKDYLYMSRYGYVIKLHFLLSSILMIAPGLSYVGAARFIFMLFMFEMIDIDVRRYKSTYQIVGYGQLIVFITSIFQLLK